jgi:hypothetical protein
MTKTFTGTYDKPLLGLCRRCEHRARFYETGATPRMECGTESHSSHSCYMYKPVAPFIMKADEGDDRPEYGPAFISARMHAVRVPEDELRLKAARLDDGSILAWYARKPGKKKTSASKPPRRR